MMRPLTLSTAFAGRATAITAHRTLASFFLHHSVRLYGSLTPGELGDTVTIQVKRPGSSVYVDLKSVYTGTMRGAAAGWSHMFKPAKRGVYRIRARFGGTADRLASVSPSVSFRVR